MRGIIIGGGIGGLCTVATLQSVGLDVRVYEVAPALKPVGSGIMMAPNAMPVFENLGIADAVKACGVSLKHLVVSDQRGRVMRRTVVSWTSVVGAPQRPQGRAHDGNGASSITTSGPDPTAAPAVL